MGDDDAQARLAECGANELAAEPPVQAWRRFLAQFRDVLVLLLIAATAISAVLWAYATRRCRDVAIFVVVMLNATLGVLHRRAPKPRSPLPRP
jgi:Ca2+-transporting ATPase